MNRRTFLKHSSFAMAVASLPTSVAANTGFRLFIGTRQPKTKLGIYSCSFDAETGACGAISLAAEQEMATFVVPSTDKKFLYAVSEVAYDGSRTGSLCAYAIGPSGTLKLLNQVPAGGIAPVCIGLDHTGKTALVSIFGATAEGKFDRGGTTAFRLLSDGRLGEQTASVMHSGSGPLPLQRDPHAHFVELSPDNRTVFVPDLGADRIFFYRFDAATGRLAPSDPPSVSLPPGSGPRQLLMHQDGRFAYAMNQFSAVITLFEWDAANIRLSEIQTISALAASDTTTPNGGGMALHPSGAFLFSATRNDSSVEVFSIDRQKGTLTFRQRTPCRGKIPWNTFVDPSGRWLFVTNFASNGIAIYQIDARTGNLTPVEPLLELPGPISVAFVPS